MDPSLWSPTVVGSVAAICTTGAFVPQVVRVWRLKHANEISLTTFLVFAIGTFVWLVYGIEILSVPVIAANSVTFALALTILVLKLSYERLPQQPAAKSA
jgi:MtN3 and saliva related transmembrane protein